MRRGLGGRIDGEDEDRRSGRTGVGWEEGRGDLQAPL